MRRILLAALALAITCIPALAQQQAQKPVSAGLALTPPMGWNSWYIFHSSVTEQDIKNAADMLVSSGMRDAGYIYVNIDASWPGERDANGVLHANSKFPDMKGLGDYIHARGLKFGIYSSPGPLTCGGHYAGSFGHEEQDAKLYASWGVDFLKYDLCSFGSNMAAAAKAHPDDPDAANDLMIAAYAKMRKALDDTGRPIVFSLCQYGVGDVWKWGAQIGGNLWRTTDDISASYDRMSVIGFSQAGLSKYAGPGHWNDPDMLQVGLGKMKHDEYVTQMSLWAILAAPLLVSNDLTKMGEDTKSILMNKAVIAIDQDPLGKQGDRLFAEGPHEVWTKPLSHGALAVGLFNRGYTAGDAVVTLKQLGVSDSQTIAELWTGKEIKAKNGVIKLRLPRHGAALLRISK